MKPLNALPPTLLLAFLLLTVSCTQQAPENRRGGAVTPTQTNSGDIKPLLPPTPAATPVTQGEGATRGSTWVAGVKYYFLTIGDKTYHGVKGSETELWTCMGKRISIENGELAPTDIPCGDYNLKGRKVSEDDEREIEAENEPCEAGGSDDLEAAEGPDMSDVIDLAKAIKEDMIEAEPQGEGLHYMKLSLSLKINMPIYVRVPPGTVFVPGTGGGRSGNNSQRMISTTTTTKRLEYPGEEVCISVPVACLDIELDVPQSGEAFSLGNISALPQSSSLRSLINSPEFRREGSVIKQAAIWIVRSDPPADHKYFRGVPDEFLKRVRTLLQQANIPSDQYQIFNHLD